MYVKFENLKKFKNLEKGFSYFFMGKGPQMTFTLGFIRFCVYVFRKYTRTHKLFVEYYRCII